MMGILWETLRQQFLAVYLRLSNVPLAPQCLTLLLRLVVSDPRCPTVLPRL